jgi:SatD family (SatD)
VTKNDIYVAVLADVVGSRALPPKERARLQNDLRYRLRKDLNRRKRWHDKIAAGFALARGDEIQGLLRDASMVWEITHWLRGVFFEVDWIIACARGPISTALAPTAVEVDGPCFHAARVALEDAKRHRQVFAFSGFSPTVDGMAAYHSALYWSWTRGQRRLAAQFRFDGPALDELKDRLKVHPTAISHMKRRMAWPLVAAGDKMFRAAILEAR